MSEELHVYCHSCEKSLGTVGSDEAARARANKIAHKGHDVSWAEEPVEGDTR